MTTKTPLTRELIDQYIWKRYIDNTSNYPEVDDSEALDFLERYYAKHPVNEDEESFYYGVLLFERAWQTEDEALQARLLLKARDILSMYRRLSEEEDWDVVEDRLDECRDFIAENDLNAAPDAPPKIEIVDGMILIKAGSFRFGATSEEKFLESYFIDRDPVSNMDYRKFLEETSYRAPAIWQERTSSSEDELPVTGISWMDAQKYCKWANKELPSEEQWEKAARGLNGNPYPWGDSEPSATTANFASGEEACSLKPLSGYDENVSQFGCRYTVGHVWEWTNTSYQGEGRNRVIKGGSWSDPNDSRYLSTHARLWAEVKAKSDIVGFRCARPATSI